MLCFFLSPRVFRVNRTRPDKGKRDGTHRLTPPQGHDSLLHCAAFSHTIVFGHPVILSFGRFLEESCHDHNFLLSRNQNQAASQVRIAPPFNVNVHLQTRLRDRTKLQPKASRLPLLVSLSGRSIVIAGVALGGAWLWWNTGQAAMPAPRPMAKVQHVRDSGPPEIDEKKAVQQVEQPAPGRILAVDPALPNAMPPCYDLGKGMELAPHVRFRANVGHVAISGNGEVIACCVEKEILLIDVVTRKTISTVPDENGGVLALSPNGAKLAVLSPESKSMTIRDVRTGKSIQKLRDMSVIWQTKALFSPGGRYVITVNPGGHPSIWDTRIERNGDKPNALVVESTFLKMANTCCWATASNFRSTPSRP